MTSPESSTAAETASAAELTSHRTPDGRFHNPWPGTRPKGFGAVLRWSAARAVRRLRGGGGTSPVALPIVPSAIVSPRQADDSLRVTWVGHSTVLLQLGATNVLTDPMWGSRASPIAWAGPKRLVPPAVPFDALPPIDVVALSHDHYDHLDAPTVRRLAAAHPEARWVTTLGVGERLVALGVRQAVELDWWQSTQASDVTVTATPAQHFSGRTLADRDRTLWAGFAIAGGGWRVFFAGDTGYHPEFATIASRLGPFDLVLMPIGAYAPRWFMRPVHVNADEAVAATVAIGAAQGGRTPPMLGIHWGTFRLTEEPTDEPPRHAMRAWTARGLPDADCWILRHGETRSLVRPAGGG